METRRQRFGRWCLPVDADRLHARRRSRTLTDAAASVSSNKIGISPIESTLSNTISDDFIAPNATMAAARRWRMAAACCRLRALRSRRARGFLWWRSHPSASSRPSDAPLNFNMSQLAARRGAAAAGAAAITAAATSAASSTPANHVPRRHPTSSSPMTPSPTPRRSSRRRWSSDGDPFRELRHEPGRLGMDSRRE